MRILSNGAKFMLVDRPLLPAYIFFGHSGLQLSFGGSMWSA